MTRADIRKARSAQLYEEAGQARSGCAFGACGLNQVLLEESPSNNAHCNWHVLPQANSIN